MTLMARLQSVDWTGGHFLVLNITFLYCFLTLVRLKNVLSY